MHFSSCAADDAMRLMQRGAEARHVGETRLNRESSRSHSVFTCTVERHTKSDNGLTNILFSRLNLIDLAGRRALSFTASPALQSGKLCRALSVTAFQLVSFWFAA